MQKSPARGLALFLAGELLLIFAVMMGLMAVSSAGSGPRETAMAVLFAALALAVFAFVRSRAKPGRRLFFAPFLAFFGSIFLPVLFIPAVLLVLWAYPSYSVLLFATGWVLVWLAHLAAVPFIRCPACGSPFFRVGASFRLDPRACASCGAPKHAA
jgi:hypothetical protein